MALPKTVYVKQERDGKNSWLVADLKPSGLVEDTPILVGEYKLVRTVRVSRETKVEPVK